MNIIMMALFVILVLSDPGICQTQNDPVNPHLQLFEKYRISLQNLGLRTGNARVREMAHDFTFGSLKAQPDANGFEVTRLIPEETPWGGERFRVVPVLESDCELSSFWRKVCRNIRGAGLIDGPAGSRPILVLRDTPMTEFGRGMELAYAMAFLEETPDFKCPEGTTPEQAEAFELQAKKAMADELLRELAETATKKGLLK